MVRSTLVPPCCLLQLLGKGSLGETGGGLQSPPQHGSLICLTLQPLTPSPPLVPRDPSDPLPPVGGGARYFWQRRAATSQAEHQLDTGASMMASLVGKTVAVAGAALDKYHAVSGAEMLDALMGCGVATGGGRAALMACGERGRAALLACGVATGGQDSCSC